MTQNRKNPPGFNEEIFRQALEDDAKTAPSPATKKPEADRPVAATTVSAETNAASGKTSENSQNKAVADTRTDQPPSSQSGSDRFSWLAMIVIGLSILGFSASNWMTNNKVEALSKKITALEARLDQPRLAGDSDSDLTAVWLQDVAEEISSGDDAVVSEDEMSAEAMARRVAGSLKAEAVIPDKPEPLESVKAVPETPVAVKAEPNRPQTVATAMPAATSPELKSVKRPPPPAATGEIHTLAGSVQKYVLAPVGNGRSAPDTQSRVMAKLKKGMTVTALLRQGSWYQVQLDDGTKVWAHQSIFGRPPLTLPANNAFRAGAKKQGQASVPEPPPETMAVIESLAVEKDAGIKALAVGPEVRSVGTLPASAASDNRKRGWAVYLTSLKSEEIADRELARLQSQGIQAEKHIAMVRGEKYFQLRTGQFEKTEEALARMRQVAAKVGYKDAWIARR